MVGTGLSVMGKIQEGRYNEAALNMQARNEEAQGKEELAASQRTAEEKRREAQLANSRQIAIAAGSGAGVTNPTVVDIFEKTAERGEYLAQTELYGGKSRKAGYEDKAAASRFRGKQAKSGSIFDAIATGVSGFNKAYGYG
jgi:signal recognition particle GTPase